MTYNNGVEPPSGVGTAVRHQLEWPNSVLRSLIVYRSHRQAVFESINQLPSGAESAGVSDGVRLFSRLAVDVAEAFGQRLGVDRRDDDGIADLFVIDEQPPSDGWREIKTCRLGESRWAAAVETIPVTPAGRPIPTEPPEVKGDCVSIRYQEPEASVFGREGIWVRRRVLLSGLDVLVNENAWAGVELRRNEHLAKGRVTSARFVYRTAAIRFGSHLTPTVRHNQRVDVTDGSVDATHVHVRRMLATLLDASKVDRQRRDSARVEIGWGYDNELLLEMNPDLDRDPTLLNDRAPDPHGRLVALDIGFGNERRTGLDSIGDVAATVAAAVDSFRRGRRLPTISSGPDAGKVRGSIVFHVSVYARTEGENKPILKLGNLWLPLARIG